MKVFGLIGTLSYESIFWNACFSGPFGIVVIFSVSALRGTHELLASGACATALGSSGGRHTHAFHWILPPSFICFLSHASDCGAATRVSAARPRSAAPLFFAPPVTEARAA